MQIAKATNILATDEGATDSPQKPHVKLPHIIELEETMETPWFLTRNHISFAMAFWLIVQRSVK